MEKFARLFWLGGACLMLLLGLAGIASAQQQIVVPEIDPATAGTGLALLGGASLLLIERFRRR